MIILDTHALLWMDRNDASLGSQSRRLIEDAWRTDTVAVSAISFWEAAMLAQRGRIVLPVAVETWRADLLQAGIREISINGRIALLATSFHNLHRDPADRFIVATAMHHGALLVTADSKILEWQADLSSQDARA
ncbi:MAG: type II toxin-antitoxin system VapC family toxin [Gallionella sp.]|nr:type II toxin-antitoxin system VapC family toxin [Gallionella sp.]